MKSFIKISSIFILLLAAMACNKPKSIPDSKFKSIIKDIYLTNAYYSTEQHFDTDTVDIYTPVLKKYGYTLKDFEHTLNEFSRKKSTKFSDVVDQVVKELESEQKIWQERTAVLDTIDNAALRRLSETVLRRDSLILSNIRDTARLRFVIPVKEGKYDISYKYRIDTSDKNRGIKTTFTFNDNKGKNTGSSTNWMNNRSRQTYTATLEPKAGDSTLTILFGNYSKTATKPSLRIDTLKVVYSPPLQIALDSLEVFLYRHFFTPSYDKPEKTEDHSELRADSLGDR